MFKILKQSDTVVFFFHEESGEILVFDCEFLHLPIDLTCLLLAGALDEPPVFERKKAIEMDQ